MKKIFIGLLAIGLVQFCSAQSKVNSDIKPAPPVIKKNLPPPQKVEKVKPTPPVITKDNIDKPPPPPPPAPKKKYHHSTKKEKTKFTPPVIKRDDSKN